MSDEPRRRSRTVEEREGAGERTPEIQAAIDAILPAVAACVRRTREKRAERETARPAQEGGATAPMLDAAPERASWDTDRAP